jgi:hypothetical protein
METPPGTPHAHSMKTLSRFLVLPLLLLLVASAFTRPIRSAQTKQLSQYGQPRDAVDLLLRTKSPPTDDASRKITWSLIGSAYRVMKAYENARLCYERATYILSEIPNTQADYASAIDNLSAAKELTGLLHAATILRTVSKRLHQGHCNHNSQVDLKMELASLDALHNAILNKETARLVKDAAPTLSNPRVRRRAGCTMSAESFQ